MLDPDRNKKLKHPPSRKGKKASGRSGGPQVKRKLKRKEMRVGAQAEKSGTEREPIDPGDECRWPRLRRPLRWIRRHHIEIGIVLALLAIIAAVAVPLLVAMRFQVPRPPEPGVVGILRFVPQVKSSGEEVWADVVEVQDRDDRVAGGIRLENLAYQPITGLVVRARLPTAFLPNGKCRYGINQLAITPCRGSPYSGSGISLPGLQPEDRLHLVFEARIPADIPGGRHIIKMSVNSNQTEAIEKTAEVHVLPTVAEEVVRDLFAQTESEGEFWDGRPEMAPSSKWLLIHRWPDMALEEVHRFGEVPGESSIGLAELFYDHTHEGQVVRLAGRITGPLSAFPKSARVVKQSYEVAVTGEGPRLRCYTWRPVDRLLQRGDELEIKAIPIAWSPHGGGDEVTMAVCLAVRTIRSDDR